MSLISPQQIKELGATANYFNVVSKNLLMIFTRNPQLGKCKTRLAAKVGDQAALDIYKFLLEHTVTITKNLSTAKQVWYSEEIWEDDIWDSAVFDKRLQHGDHLGKRMANAFQEGFASGYEKIIIIGSDMYDLDQPDLQEAFSLLTDNDFVVGPAHDGGYYLLGMKIFDPELFRDKDWGSDTVLQDTLNNLKNKKYRILEERNDIDHYEDIKDDTAFRQFLKHIKK